MVSRSMTSAYIFLVNVYQRCNYYEIVQCSCPHHEVTDFFKWFLFFSSSSPSVFVIVNYNLKEKDDGSETMRTTNEMLSLYTKFQWSILSLFKVIWSWKWFRMVQKGALCYQRETCWRLDWFNADLRFIFWDDVRGRGPLFRSGRLTSIQHEMHTGANGEDLFLYIYICLYMCMYLINKNWICLKNLEEIESAEIKKKKESWRHDLPRGGKPAPGPSLTKSHFHSVLFDFGYSDKSKLLFVESYSVHFSNECASCWAFW